MTADAASSFGARRLQSVISALCHLLVHAGERLSRAELGVAFGDVVDVLIAAGFIVPAAKLTAINCPACDDSHELELEWDAERGCYRGYCPDAGFVYPDDERLRSYSMDTERLLTALKGALGIAKEAHRVLVVGRARFLGTAITNGKMWNAILLSRLRTMEEQTQLAAAVKLLPQVGLYVALVTSMVPLGFERWELHHLLLGEVVEIDPESPSSLALRHEQLQTWLDAFEAGRERPRPNNRGRPIMDDKIVAVFQLLAAESRLTGKQIRDATAIREDWKRVHPGDKCPAGKSTIVRWLQNRSDYSLLKNTQK